MTHIDEPGLGTSDANIVKQYVSCQPRDLLRSVLEANAWFGKRHIGFGYSNELWCRIIQYRFNDDNS